MGRRPGLRVVLAVLLVVVPRVVLLAVLRVVPQEDSPAVVLLVPAPLEASRVARPELSPAAPRDPAREEVHLHPPSPA